MHLPPLDLLLEEIRRLAHEAGAEILRHYGDAPEARTKADASPVTAADEAAECLILSGLTSLTPDVPMVAEERVAAGDVPDVGDGAFWLVDPLDGTKEFLKRNGEFTVNVALVRGHRPVLGIVHAPALARSYFGVTDGLGGAGRAYREDTGRPRAEITARPCPPQGATVLVSRSHRDPETERFLHTVKVAEEAQAGSALKFCLVAEGGADLYPRFGRTMEWDTAAGHAVLAAAGGSVRTPEGGEFAYGKPGFANPPFIARGRE